MHAFCGRANLRIVTVGALKAEINKTSSASDWTTHPGMMVKDKTKARSVTWIPAWGVRTWPTRSQLQATAAGAERVRGPGWNQALGYNDVLQLGDLLGTDVMISVG